MRTPSVRCAAAGAIVAAVIFCAPGLLVGFSTIGGSLGIATTGYGWQRDVRVFNNANDAAANNNTTPDPAYPGALGAALAVWKAARAWASDNPLAARNFDYDWQGVSSTFGESNIVAWDASACGGGVLAFTTVPISAGWSITMCDNWTWSDGPGNPGGGQMDIQGVAAHELGHALGLGHSTSNCGNCTNSATMCPAICSTGAAERTINTDDQAGLAAVYGSIPAGKPVILGLAGSTTTLQTLVINGTGFAANVNVKFTAKTGQDLGAIPGVVYNVPSANGGTQVSVAIPYYADDGNVIVWDPVAGVISNAFPIDVNYVAPPPPPAPGIASISPSQITAFQGGVVTIFGSHFTGATQVQVGSSVLTAPFGYTFVNDTTITLNSPSAPGVLGPASVTVTGPGGVSNVAILTFAETLPPKLSAPGFAISNTSFTWTFGAGVNDVVVLIASTDATTFDFGTPYHFLLNFTVLGQAAANPLGLGSFGLTIPPGLAGVAFFSQVAAIDELNSALSASNVTATTILL